MERRLEEVAESLWRWTEGMKLEISLDRGNETKGDED